MAYDEHLADRVRSALAAQGSVREVRMFGGLASMVDDAMVVCVGSPGTDLLVRVDPERDEHYRQVGGARTAEMGSGRSMGPGWLAVDAEVVDTDEGLSFWLDAALEFNARARRSRRPKGPA